MMIKHSKPNLTVFTDASVLPKKNSAGWGGWCRRDSRPSVFHSGKAPFDKNSTTVEAYAMHQMVAHIVNTGYVTDTDKSIMLQSDSLHFLQDLLHLPSAWPTKHSHGSDILAATKNRNQKVMHRTTQIGLILQNFDVIYLRHVKGHMCSSTSGRQWVNNKCDELAKRAARGPV